MKQLSRLILFPFLLSVTKRQTLNTNYRENNKNISLMTLRDKMNQKNSGQNSE